MSTEPVRVADFEMMPLAELKALRRDLDVVIARRIDADKAAMKAKLESIVADAGLVLEEVLGLAKRRRPRVVRYRDPDDPELVWNGRGRMPEWLWEHVNAGRNKEDFAVEREVVPHVNGAT